MSVLNNINLSELEQFVSEPQKHIEAFIATFEQSFLNAGPNSFVPMVTMFKNPNEFEISIQCRNYEDKDDMYKAFNEMLQFFSAAEAHSFIFAVDIRKTTYDQNNPHSKTTEATDALSLSFVSETSSGIVTLPYRIVDNKIEWSVSEFDLSNMTEESPEKKYQGDIPELFYLMTHLPGPMFTPSQLLNYYNYNNFMYIISDTTSVEAIKVEQS